MYDFSLGSLSRSFRDKPCRAVIYGRASEHEAQVKALENQMQWYEESRKISERSRAGQRVSREKGVVYGTGNIFRYSRNKLTKQFEIDPEQAETVKMIFDLMTPAWEEHWWPRS